MSHPGPGGALVPDQIESDITNTYIDCNNFCKNKIKSFRAQWSRKKTWWKSDPDIQGILFGVYQSGIPGSLVVYIGTLYIWYN